MMHKKEIREKEKYFCFSVVKTAKYIKEKRIDSWTWLLELYCLTNETFSLSLWIDWSINLYALTPCWWSPYYESALNHKFILGTWNFHLLYSNKHQKFNYSLLLHPLCRDFIILNIPSEMINERALCWDHDNRLCNYIL